MGAVASLPESDAAGRARGVPLGSTWFREQAGEFAARACISGLFVVLATRIGREFIETGHVMNQRPSRVLVSRAEFRDERRYQLVRAEKFLRDPIGHWIRQASDRRGQRWNGDRRLLR